MEVPCHPKEIIFQYEQCDACGICLKISPENAIAWITPKKAE